MIESYLKIMEIRYKELQSCSTNSSRRYRENIMLSLMEEHSELKEYWEYDGSQYYVKNRFIKKHKQTEIIVSTKEKAEVNWDDISDSGLYLVGTTTFNPFTDERFYWIKVGKALTLRKRIRDYKTHNPAIWVSDFRVIENPTTRDSRETVCHHILRENSLTTAENTKEWFRVDREKYLEICEKGFAFFEEALDNIISF